MAPLSHALILPGLIILLVLLWAWIPLAILIWCIRRGRHGRNEPARLESGHVPHPGFEPPLSVNTDESELDYLSRGNGTRTYDHKREHKAGKATHEQHARMYEKEDGKNGQGREGQDRKTERKQRETKAKGKHRPGGGKNRAQDNDETPLVQPESLAAQESARQRRLMDESRGYPSQNYI